MFTASVMSDIGASRLVEPSSTIAANTSKVSVMLNDSILPSTTRKPMSFPSEQTAKGTDSQNAAPVITLEPSAPVASKPTWPVLTENHPLSKFLDNLPDILKSTSHDEVYGIYLKLRDETFTPDFHTLLILQKFLRANQNDLAKAQDQLSRTLKWRKEFDPIKAAAETFDKNKFEGLGYIVTVPSKEVDALVVTTWNIYGAVKDYEKTFVPVESFLRWRIGLMEAGVAKMGLANATIPIPNCNEGEDPYQGIQVHDYKNFSFLRMDARAKAASKATIELLGNYYPETLSRKFFVNIPAIMGWLYSGMKLLVNAQTMKKFVVLNDGIYIAGELGKSVPNEYGGTLGDLRRVGEELKME